MNETLLWLLYCVSGGLALAAVYYWRWHIALALFAGGALTAAGWSLLYRLTPEEQKPDWVTLDVSLNITFGLIFAAFGTAAGLWLSKRRRPAD